MSVANVSSCKFVRFRYKYYRPIVNLRYDLDVFWGRLISWFVSPYQSYGQASRATFKWRMLIRRAGETEALAESKKIRVKKFSVSFASKDELINAKAVFVA